jgi:hypothetical protein
LNEEEFSDIEDFQKSLRKDDDKDRLLKLREAKIKWIKKKVDKHESFDYGHPSRYEEFIRLTEHAKLDI